MTLVIRFNRHQGSLTEILVGMQQDHRVSPLLWSSGQKCKKRSLREWSNYKFLPKLAPSHLHLRIKVSVGHVLQCWRWGCYFSWIPTASNPRVKLTISPQRILEEDAAWGNTEGFCEFCAENTRRSDWHSDNFWSDVSHILQGGVSHEQPNLPLIHRNTVFCLWLKKKWSAVVNF